MSRSGDRSSMRWLPGVWPYSTLHRSSPFWLLSRNIRFTASSLSSRSPPSPFAAGHLQRFKISFNSTCCPQPYEPQSKSLYTTKMAKKKSKKTQFVSQGRTRSAGGKLYLEAERVVLLPASRPSSRGVGTASESSRMRRVSTPRLAFIGYSEPN